ncbi:MAG: CotH kinase family protein [Verrucomicrobiales bacterium]|nr:CotH kinase family protein [Verrucomicrobiales bacterium]
MKYLFLSLLLFPFISLADENQIQFTFDDGTFSLSTTGKKKQEWLFQFSEDMEKWEPLYDVPPIFSDGNSSAILNLSNQELSGFVRAIQTEGFYDPMCVRTIELTFEDTNWQSQLISNYSTGNEISGTLQFRDETIEGVGVRYKGNTSYQRVNGEKKSVNISLDATHEDADLEGLDTLNLNNAAGDQTLLREALYFNTMKKYAACPGAGFVQLNINGENWGVYSNAQQQDSPLIRQYFGSNDGDRWKSPSGTGSGAGAPGGGGRPPGGGGRPPGGGGRPPGGGGGGGGWSSGDKALLYLGNNPSTYENLYELKKQNSDDPWANLIHATDVLNNTPAGEFKTKVNEVLAVDSWLWFLVLENIFTDDDSYWHKGCDYMIYYEPESGRLFPIEHDGNEAFNPRYALLNPFDQETNVNRPVINKLLSVPEFRQRYIAHMRTVLENDFNPENLTAAIDRYVKTIETFIENDPKKDFNMTSFRSSISQLKDLINTRYQYLSTHPEISKVPPSIISVPVPTNATANQPTTITAKVIESKTDGIHSVFLYYTPKGHIDPYTSVEMFDDGNHNDLEPNDGIYGASVPGFFSGEKVWYYIEARSGNSSNTAAFYPKMTEVEPLSYRVQSLNYEEESPVIINEIMALNETTLQDPQEEFDDWIELHNITDQSFDLSGWHLSDNPNNPRKWEFPEGSLVPANGYMIVWADEDGGASEGVHASFKLSSNGESLYLTSSDQDGNYIMDQIQFGPQEQDISFGRTSSSEANFETMAPSPGQANGP